MPRIVPSLDSAPRDSLRYLLALAVVITALYVGAEIFVPLALAVLLSFMLAPGVRLLQSWHLGRVFPVLAMSGIAFLAILGLAAVLAMQLRDLATDLPRYETTITAKVEALRGLTSGDGTKRFSDFVAGVTRHLKADRQPAPAPVGATVPPMPVVVERPAELPLETLGRYLAPALHPLVMAGIVALYVVFMLMQREDLRNRAIRLFGAGDLHRSTAALDDAARRLSRYLLAQLAVNTASGLVVGIALAVIGIPSPMLWGILFGCLRFVPYVGPPLAAAVPIALAAAVAPGWSVVLWTALLYFALEGTIGQVVEPLVYGHNTGLSPVAVVIAATFWTVLWGPVGLVLATPMTVCLVVLGRHVEPLAFLDILLGDRPALAPAEVFYQRMLADDPVEASDQAEIVLKERSLTDYYDSVLLQGLLLAQQDVTQGRLDEERQRRIAAAAAEVVENLSEQEDAAHPSPPEAARSIVDKFVGRPPAEGAAIEGRVPAQDLLAERWRRPGAVLCIGGRAPLDDAAAAALAQLLGKHGFGAEAVSFEHLAKARIGGLQFDRAALVCLSCLDGSSAAYVRFIVRRIRRANPDVPVLIGAWWRGAAPAEGEGKGAVGPAGEATRDAAEGREAVSTLAEAIVHGQRLAAMGEDGREESGQSAVAAQ